MTFEGETVAKVRRAFIESVDDYLTFCKQRGEAPEKPFSGKFVARISPEIHRRVSEIAARTGKSLNQLVADALSQLAGERDATRPREHAAGPAKKRRRPAKK